MSDLDDVARIALSLPDVRREGDGFKVCKANVVWLWRERVDPKKTKVPNPGVVVVRVIDLADKEALIAEHSECCFTEPHYDGYKAVLVRLDSVEPDLLAELITDSYRCAAPRSLVARLDAAS